MVVYEDFSLLFSVELRRDLNDLLNFRLDSPKAIKGALSSSRYCNSGGIDFSVTYNQVHNYIYITAHIWMVMMVMVMSTVTAHDPLY